MTSVLRLVQLPDGTVAVLMDGPKKAGRFHFEERGEQPFSPHELHVMNSHHELHHVLGGWRRPVEN